MAFINTRCNLNTSDGIGIFNKFAYTPLQNSVSNFSLRSVNWFGPNEKAFTFLENGTNTFFNQHWLHTKDDVLLTQDVDLPETLLFSFENCSSSKTNTKYGEIIRIRSKYEFGSNSYVQCGGIGRTCSRVDNPGRSCDNNVWQTFKLVSVNGKADGTNVCYGDDVRISNIASEDSGDITAADATMVFLTPHNSNPNSIFKILPPNGTLYANINNDIDNHVTMFNESMCKKNFTYCPLLWYKKSVQSLSAFFTKWKYVIYILLGLIVFWILLGFAVKMKQLIV